MQNDKLNTICKHWKPVISKSQHSSSPIWQNTPAPARQKLAVSNCDFIAVWIMLLKSDKTKSKWLCTHMFQDQVLSNHPSWPSFVWIGQDLLKEYVIYARIYSYYSPFIHGQCYVAKNSHWSSISSQLRCFFTFCRFTAFGWGPFLARGSCHICHQVILYYLKGQLAYLRASMTFLAFLRLPGSPFDG